MKRHDLVVPGEGRRSESYEGVVIRFSLTPSMTLRSLPTGSVQASTRLRKFRPCPLLGRGVVRGCCCPPPRTGERSARPESSASGRLAGAFSCPVVCRPNSLERFELLLTFLNTPCPGAFETSTARLTVSSRQSIPHREYPRPDCRRRSQTTVELHVRRKQPRRARDLENSAP